MSNEQTFDILSQRRPDSPDADQAKLDERQASEDLKWLMADKRGRRFMWRLLSDTGLFRSSFTGNSQTFFLEGRRDVGLKQLNNVMDDCPHRFNEMMKEQQK